MNSTFKLCVHSEYSYQDTTSGEAGTPVGLKVI